MAAVLNSTSVNEIIKPFQSTGLLGERHVEKKLLDVPIPTFDSATALHRKLSELGEKAHRQAQAVISGQDFPAGGSLARQRACIRTALGQTLTKIDGLVRNLLSLE